jgi:PAS domain S-box-containing protein
MVRGAGRDEGGALNAQHHLAPLIDSIRDYAVFMLNVDGRIETWNTGAQLIKGYTEQEIVGQTIHRFYTAEDRVAGRPERLLATAARDGRVEDEGWRVRKNGERFWADVVISAMRDADGTLVGFVKVTRDLTERRRIDEERLQHEQALARSQEALRLRDEFLSIASHELRTPLMALQLQLDSLRLSARNLDARQAHKLDRAGRNVQRLVELIAALLDVSRMARGKLAIAPEHVDLGVVVAETVDRLQESANEARCAIHTQLARDITGIWDPLRIGQVVANLLSNAFRYAAGTAVDVTLERRDHHAILSVLDRGPGIPADQLERVFVRFERAAPSRNYGGMGLGLYVAREIVTAHGGTITASNRDDGGARLETVLPIREDTK